MTLYTTLLQFGDGTHHEIEIEADTPEEAAEEAKDWVLDNAWIEVYDDEGAHVEAEVRLQ